MDILAGILSQLGVDNTFFFQFVIFMVVFVFLWNVTFSAYFKAYEVRESKTTGSEAEADELLKQTESLEKEYQDKARALNAEIKEVFDAERKAANKEQEKIVNEAREEAKSYVATAREKIQSEYNRAREELFSETNSIGQSMAAKLTQQGGQ